MIEYISAGNTVTLAIRVMVAGVGQDSVSPAPTVKIQRYSDGLWLNTNNETFEAYDAFSAYRSLVAVASDLSRYTYAWNTGTITNVVANDTYFATIDVSAPHPYSVTGEISTALIPAVRSGLALASALATVQAGVTTLLAGVNVAAMYADVITGTALASSAVTKAGLATLAAIAATTVDVVAARKRLTNRRAIAANGVETLYDDDGVTALKTRTYTDVTGGAVVINAGEPARASVES